ncbi:MAG TPA: substrate-binding domain-containing protein [Mycobacteriales bacterium]|nr:substrate-binding domain-containing protein [Mycobacteriales bacterium]
MGKRLWAAAALCGALVATTAAGCGNSDSTSDGAAGKTPKIGVILPDSKTSARWETADRKYLKEAFEKAGVKYDIQNAQGDPAQFQTIADAMITNGATALMIVNLDAGSGKAVLKKATDAGIPTIDYDRPTLGGSAKYYVSFDNVKVGKLQGEGLDKCLQAAKAPKGAEIVYLNGSPDDNNATLFKQGYASALDPKVKDGTYKLVADQAVPKWDNQTGGTIFEQMLTSHPQIAGAAIANDGLAGAAIAILKKNGLNGKVPVTGQDATVEGLQAVLAGDQCMTVYKAVKKEAEAAATLALDLANGKEGKTTGTLHDPVGNRDIPSILLEPLSITKENVKDVVTDGYVTKDKLCTGRYAAMCAAAGI